MWSEKSKTVKPTEMHAQLAVEIDVTIHEQTQKQMLASLDKDRALGIY